MNSQPSLLVLTYFNSMKRPFYQKDTNQITFNQPTHVKLSLNIRGLHSNFVGCESFFEPNSPQTLSKFLIYARQTWMAQSILAISL